MPSSSNSFRCRCEHMFVVSIVNISIKQLLPNPQDGDGTNNAEDEVSEIAFSKQFYIQQVANERSYIAANNAHDKVHTTSFAFTAHDAIGNITNKNARQYWPSRKFYKMF